jgi:HlyD family secretion protein
MMHARIAALVLVALPLTACRTGETVTPRASGYVEATETRVSARVAGRIARVAVVEGARVHQGDVVAAVATDDLDLALRRAEAERAQAAAQLRLVQRGPRAEDIALARAQAAAAAGDTKAAQAEVENAKTDEARFQQLLDRRAGSAKQRDDATARRRLAEAHLAAATDRQAAAAAAVARLEAGSRAEEIQAAAARHGAADAAIATLEHDRDETTMTAPAGGVVTSRLVEPGELVAAGTPVAVILDLDHAWVNAYVEEPTVPSLRIDQAVTVVTDGGDRLPGRISVIGSHAEFTPRNVQTAAERATLVYRVKVTVDNAAGVLKPGMPVEVEMGARP